MLKVVDYNILCSDVRVVIMILNLLEGSWRVGDFKGIICIKIFIIDIIYLENLRIIWKYCNFKIDDEISSCFLEKENNV